MLSLFSLGCPLSASSVPLSDVNGPEDLLPCFLEHYRQSTDLESLEDLSHVTVDSAQFYLRDASSDSLLPLEEVSQINDGSTIAVLIEGSGADPGAAEAAEGSDKAASAMDSGAASATNGASGADGAEESEAERLRREVAELKRRLSETAAATAAGGGRGGNGGAAASSSGHHRGDGKDGRKQSGKQRSRAHRAQHSTETHYRPPPDRPTHSAASLSQSPLTGPLPLPLCCVKRPLALALTSAALAEPVRVA